MRGERGAPAAFRFLCGEPARSEDAFLESALDLGVPSE